MATTPCSPNGKGMATLPISPKRKTMPALPCSPHGHLSNLAKGKEDGHPAILTKGQEAWPDLHSIQISQSFDIDFVLVIVYYISHSSIIDIIEF